MMKRCVPFFKQKAYEFRGALLSGFLVGTSYIPFPPWALLFCYIPLWLTVTCDCKTPWQAFKQGWITQFVLSLIGFHWIAYTAHEFGEVPWVLSVIALLLFCIFMHVYVALSAAFVVILRDKFHLKRLSTLLLLALLHSLFERLWPSIFPWNLGYPLLWGQWPLYQWADVIGFEGLSSVVLLCNAWLAYIWLTRTRKVALLSLATFIVLFALANLVGLWKGREWSRFDSQVRATLIQANIGNQEKIIAEAGRGFQEEIIHRFLRLTKAAAQAHPETDIFIWPETAFPDYLDQYYLDRKHPQQLVEGLHVFGKPLMTGAYSRDSNANSGDRSSYNALFLVSPFAQSLDRPYRKTELLAFGEYLPLSETFPILLKWLPFVSNFGRGQGPDIMTWSHEGRDIRWGGQICYEGLYPAFTRGLAEKKADILINVTNDSWFGRTSEPHQHLYMTLARAIEVRRPLIRSTNTGISTGILADGELLQKSPLHQEWFGHFVIRYQMDAPETFFVRFGHWDWLVLIATVMVILLRGYYATGTRRS